MLLTTCLFKKEEGRKRERQRGRMIGRRTSGEKDNREWREGGRGRLKLSRDVYPRKCTPLYRNELM